MKVNFDSKNSHQTFGIKISERFLNSLHGHVNNGENRLRNNYLLNNKLKEYESFGFNDYTMHMQQKSSPLGFEYNLFAVKDKLAHCAYKE